MLFGQEFMPLEDLLFFGAASGGKLSEYTASGNPVVFETDVSRPLKRLALSLLPRQSGSGDPSPENIRPLLPWGDVGTWTGGKNLLNIDRTEASPNPNDIFVSPRRMDTEHYYVGLQSANYYYKPYATAIVENGTVTVETNNNNSYGVGFPVSVKGGKSYTLSATTENGLVSFGFYDDEWNYISESSAITTLPTTVITPQNASYAVVVFRSWENGGTRTYSDIQLEVGNQATAFTPYTPITPHPVNVGKNLLKYTIGQTRQNNGVDYAILSDGGQSCKGTATATSYAIDSSQTILHAGIYTVSVSGAVSMKTVIVKNGAYFRQIPGNGYSTFSVTEDTEISCYSFANNGDTVNETIYVQLEQGETATAFQPYLPPVYGCELDLTTGEVWGTHIASELTAVGKQGNFFYNTLTSLGLQNIKGTNKGLVCDRLRINPNTSESETTDSITVYSSGIIRFVVPEFINSTVQEFNEGTKGNRIQFAYELATPVLLATLTPQQISALVGVNTVWSDADDVDVTYLKKG